MRSVRYRTPRGLCFATKKRLLSIHEDEVHFDARLSTFYRWVLPPHMSNGPRNYHAFDVVISGDNPFLATLLAVKAVSLNLDVAITKPSNGDEWPHDLLSSAAGDTVVRSLDGFGNFPSPSAKWAMRNMLQKIADKVVYLDVEGLVISDKQPDSDLALYVDSAAVGIEMDKYQEAMVQVYQSVVSGFHKAIIDKSFKTSIFTKRLILTSVVPKLIETTSLSIEIGQKNIWLNPRIYAAGSADTTHKDGRSAVKMMISDILSCYEGKPLIGLIPKSFTTLT